LEKLLTKNVGISILAGLSIIGGAFWSRVSDSRNKTALNPTESKVATEEIAPNRSQFQELFSNKDDSTINVSDLPDVNGLAMNDHFSGEKTGIASNLSDEELAAIKFLQTPSGSTLGYDEIKDKNILYTEGAERYYAKDIKSQIATNRATLLTYGLSVTKTLTGYPFHIKLSPTEITFNIYNKKTSSESGLAELEAIRLSYEAAVKRLLALSVPKDLIPLHIKLINIADHIPQLIKNMEKIETDKLLALNSARQYVEEGRFILGALSRISDHLSNKNVVLGKENMLKLSLDILN
jgi:hypothetical protein